MNTLEKPLLSLARRPRRNRSSEAIRRLVRETRISLDDLVMPLFAIEGKQQEEQIRSMPGITRKSLDLIAKQAKKLEKLGIPAVDLFCMVPQERKDRTGSEAVRAGNLLCQAIQTVKEAAPSLCVMADIALDPFTDTGHDGICDERGVVKNDETVEQLCQMSLLCARAGADFVAPSDMMDGRIGAIRTALDQEGFIETGILSYAAKYASAFYGPFREALQSAPRFGGKKGYQMDPANRREALLEAALDEAEGADILMVKPGLPYLDVIYALREATTLPIAAYHVSGEYAVIQAAAEKGWIDGERALLESLTALKRAGSDLIFTYAAEWFAMLNDQ